MSRSLLLLLAGILILCLGWVAFFWSPQNAGVGPQLATPLAPTPMGGDFVLQSWAGEVDLRELRGKVVVLNFGYTWCPDVCPASLGFLAVALNKLHKQELAQVQGLFISVDPERDTPEHLKAYVGHFHPGILGVTGRADQIAEVAGRYGAAYQRVEQASGGGYAIDHSANIYVIDQQGRLFRTLSYGTPPDRLLEVLRELL